MKNLQNTIALCHIDNESSSADSVLRIEWSTGDGMLLVDSLTLEGAGALTLEADHGGGPISATGSYPFWAHANVGVVANIPGGENGVANCVYRIFRRCP